MMVVGVEDRERARVRTPLGVGRDRDPILDRGPVEAFRLGSWSAASAQVRTVEERHTVEAGRELELA
jgi:hypothetical protein